MKKPKSVIIQGHTYKIISDNSEVCLQELESEELRGCIKYAEQAIYISPEQMDEGWYLTLVHEIVHGIMNHMGLKDNEKVVNSVSTGLFTFITENKLWKLK